MPRILLVDDEEDLLDLLGYNFEVSGFAVDRSTTGRGALEALENRLPDLVILDVMLPDLQGFEVLRILRQRERTRGLPVILLTARGEESDVLVGFELGADDYVVKPFSPRQLLARVRAVLKRGHPREANRPPFGSGIWRSIWTPTGCCGVGPNSRFLPPSTGSSNSSPPTPVASTPGKS